MSATAVSTGARDRLPEPRPRWLRALQGAGVGGLERGHERAIAVVIEPGPLPLPGAVVNDANASDAAELLVLQRCCWVSEALANDTLEIPALLEDLSAVDQWLEARQVWVVRIRGRLVAAVRGHANSGRWEIGRLMVAPDCARRGLGRWLLRFAELQAPPHCAAIDLFTGAGSARNLGMYRNAGYQASDAHPETPGEHIRGAVHLTKPINDGDRTRSSPPMPPDLRE